MSHRSLRMGPLNDYGGALIAHYEELHAVFFQFYPDVLSNTRVSSININSRELKFDRINASV